MVKEDYLDSDDIEVATLYANIIYQEKGEEYLHEILIKGGRYFIYYDNTENIKLHKTYGENIYNQIKNNNYHKIEPYTKEKLTKVFTKMFKNV